MVQVNLKLRLTPEYIRVPMTVNQQATKEVPIMAGVVDHIITGKLIYCYTMESIRTMSGAQGFSGLPLIR